jgi:hypothetical protein
MAASAKVTGGSITSTATVVANALQLFPTRANFTGLPRAVCAIDESCIRSFGAVDGTSNGKSAQFL